MATPTNESYTVDTGNPVAGGRFLRLPQIATGSYTGNGASQSINVGFKPDLVIVKCASQYLIWHGDFGWHGRSNRLHAAESISNGITFNATGFDVGSHANVNVSAGDFDYLAIADNNSGFLKITSWIGNLTDNREIAFLSSTPEFVWVKRDSTRPGIFCHKDLAAGVSITGDATAYSNFIKALLTYGIRINAHVNVNELDGPATIGEGIECVAFMPSNFMQVVSWTGNGSTTRSIATNFTPCAMFMFRNEGTTSQPAFKSNTMAANEIGFLQNLANNTTRIGPLTGNSIDLIDATYNATGISYTAVCFKANALPTYEQFVFNSTIKGVQLSGSSSRIEIGNDASLDVGTGAFSIEWHGKLTSLPSQAIPLFMRGECDNGTVANAGRMSWGVFAYPPVDPYAHGWVGHTIRIVHTNYYAATLTESDTNYYCWNTGKVIRADEEMHIIVTHDGSGKWNLFLNGEMIKDRDMNLEVPAFGNRSNGGSGTHKVASGARFSSAGTATDAAPMTVYCLRVYNQRLSIAQAIARYKKAVFGIAVADVTPLEAWDFTVGTGTTLTALNAANNATIIGGTWVNR